MGKFNRLTVKIIAHFVLLTLVLGIGFMPCFEVETKAANNEGSITINCKCDGKDVSDIIFNAYLLATYDNHGDIVFTDKWNSYGYTLSEEMSEEEVAALASTLGNIAKSDSIESEKTATSVDGAVVFTGLKSGVYLISGDNFSIDNNTYSVTPMIVELIYDEKDELKLTVSAKFAYNSTEYEIEKLWKNDGKDSHKAIEVEIYKDGVLKETVTLDESNNWKYAFSSTDKDATFSVKEINVPENYEVSYRNEGADFVVVNTYNPPEETTTETESETEVTTDEDDTEEESEEEATKKKKHKDETESDEENGGNERDTDSNTSGDNSEKLPQTGLMWWPSIVLFVLGVILVFTGIGLKSAKEDEE